MFAAATFPNELGLRALKAPRRMLQASCISAFFSVLICAVAVRYYGLIGVFMASGTVSMLHLAVVSTLLRREAKRVTANPTHVDVSILRSPGSPTGLPILVYHHVGPRRSGIYRTLTMSPKRFERQMSWLARLGYTTPSQKAVLEWLRGDRELPPKSVMITFDDAYADLNEYALPVMQLMGFGALIFVVTAHIGGSNVFDQNEGCGRLSLMSADEIRSWASLGFEFGSHTRRHRNLTTVAPEELPDEIEGSGLDLSSILQRPTLSFAYPYGAFTEEIESRAKQTFPLIFTTQQGLNREGTPTSRMLRTVTDHHDSVVDILCRAHWGKSPIEWVRKRVATPMRPFIAPFRSRFLPKLSGDV
jgi:peptidoglycan/xylan/chitin deacetylase (PgdA/CDA1 family)